MFGRFQFTRAISDKPFFLFAGLMVFVDLADAIMSYLVPVVIEGVVGSSFSMGIILSTSSIVGLSIDFLFAKYFPNKKSMFFLKILLCLAFLFPLSLLLSTHPLVILFAMAIWGTYYEAMMFSQYHMVHELVSTRDHAWAWGVLSIIRNMSLVVGPIIASMYIDQQLSYTIISALVFFCVAAYIAVLLTYVRKHKKHYHTIIEEVTGKRSFKVELKIWWMYEKVLWPLLGLTLLIFLIESAFYSIGPLFAESLKELHAFGGLFVSLYGLPGLLMGFFIARLSKPFGKKRLAFVSGIIGGLGLLLMAFMTSAAAILIFTFIAAIGISMIMPTMTAVFEDYVSRAGKYSNDLIGLTSVFGSISYIIGPIINGFMGDQLNPQLVFGFWGSILAIYCSICLLVVKRKIRLPKHQLDLLVMKARKN